MLKKRVCLVLIASGDRSPSGCERGETRNKRYPANRSTGACGGPGFWTSRRALERALTVEKMVDQPLQS
jgi:hypothetical protein